MATSRGLSEANLKSLKIVADNVTAGTIDGFDNQPGIALGQRLAETLHVDVGDAVTLIGPRGQCTPFGCLPQTKSYPVTAIFKMGMSEYDKIMVFMPLAESQKFFHRDNTVDAIEVTTTDPDGVADTKQAISALTSGSTCATGGSATKLSSAFSISIEHDVHDPVADRHRRRVQHHLRPDDAGEGQGQGYRHPAHDGGDPGRGHARVSDHWGGNRRPRNARWLPRRRADHMERRIDPASLSCAFQDTPCSIRISTT